MAATQTVRVFFKAPTPQSSIDKPRSRTYADVQSYSMIGDMFVLTCAPAATSTDKVVKAFVPVAQVDHIDVVDG